MALQKFRDKQKMIYWIVAIVVIPSFCLFGFTGIFQQHAGNAAVGEAAGKKYTQQEFLDYYQRLRGVHLGRSVFFTFDGYSPAFGRDEETSARIAAFFSMVLRDHSKALGVTVTDEEVSTFIRMQMNYTGNDAKELQKKVESLLGGVIRLSSMYEYKLAVREWLQVRKLLQVMDDTALVPQLFADLSFEQERSQLSFRKLVIPQKNYLEAADKDLGALKAEELRERAQKFIANNQKPEMRERYPFLWSAPQWRFEYLSAPLVVPALEPKITEELLKQQYEKNKASYRNAEGKEKPFDEVKAEIETEYRKNYREDNAKQTIGTEVSRLITRLIKESASETVTAVALAQITSDPVLAGRGLMGGVSGEKPMTSEEIMKNPAFAGSAIAYVLEDLDRQFRAKEGKKDDYEQMLTLYKASFRGMSMQGRDNPIPSENGLMRLRLVDYVPGVERKLTDAAGKVDEALLAEVRKELAAEIALNMAREKAVLAMAQMDKPEFEGIAITTEKKGLLSMSRGPEAQLRGAAIGQVLQPAPQAGGYTVLQLTGRETAKPTMQEEAQQLTELSSFWRGNSEYVSQSAFNPVIKIGHRLSRYFFTEFQNGNIRYFEKGVGQE